LKKALEVEKKAQDFEQKNNELTVARNIKLRSELNLQNEQAKLKVNDMQQQRDKAL
jgi:hypothetical protein